MRWQRWTLAVALIALGAVSLAFAALWLSLPSVDTLHQRTPAPSTRILDRHGRLLFEIFDPRTVDAGRRTPVPLERIPVHLRNATVAVEDANFYTHPGVDLVGVLRALWINLRGGEVLAGGSTITQQLARIMLLSPEERAQRTVLRKLRESLLAWQISQRFTKDKVLELYLNEAYYGNLAYGVEAAAQAYFGRSVSTLSLAECALLAGLTQAPAHYDPFAQPELARQRQKVVLDLMVRQGMISEQEAREAASAPLRFAPAPYRIRAPHFVNYVRAWLEREFGTEAVLRGGLVVTTTLDLALQDAARDAMRAHLARLNSPLDSPFGARADNAAVVVLDPQTGEILAMVGSPDFFNAAISGALNATLALRQPGSAIKPVTYAAAFSRVPGFTAATPIFDVRTAFPTREGLPYVPVNYDFRHRGPISAREALATSNNVAAVSVLQRVGLSETLALAHAMGLESLKNVERYGLALTLGGGEVRLLELSAAYAAFANGGHRVVSFAVREVRNAQGAVLLRREGGLGERVLDPRVAWLVSDILADPMARAPTFGEVSVLNLSRRAAVKTGTTTDFRDNWTIGYTPQRVVGVWVGNADGRPMPGVSGVSGAGPIWREVMEIAHRSLPERWLERPAGLVRREVCALSGLLPTPDCPHTRLEWFIAGSEPRQFDTWHRRVRIDLATGKPATAQTPAHRVAERLVLDLPVPLRAWARQQGWVLLEEQTPSHPSAFAQHPSVRLTRPDDGAIYRFASELPAHTQRIPVEVEVSLADVRRVEVVTGSGEVIAQFDAPPFHSFWALRPGEHVLYARVHLRDGRTVTSAGVRVVVRPG
ncbi:MAG: PBP1A family penicillin-binding protein [Thermoflexales bacterium]|nr:PBP1A family penicillin-binding protein [Thermoflexales bacterium]